MDHAQETSSNYGRGGLVGSLGLVSGRIFNQNACADEDSRTGKANFKTLAPAEGNPPMLFENGREERLTVVGGENIITSL